jgi:hypothetical protein
MPRAELALNSLQGSYDVRLLEVQNPMNHLRNSRRATDQIFLAGDEHSTQNSSGSSVQFNRLPFHIDHAARANAVDAR